MERPHGQRPNPFEDSNMYDDNSTLRPDESYYQTGHLPYNQQDPRNDFSRAAAYRGQAGDAAYSQQDRRHHHYDNAFQDRRSDASKSPRREGRGRYNDRDREGYRSPRYEKSRSRSRSRSPYYGGPPSRTIILEGLPLNMTQEDERPPWPLSDLQIANELKTNFKAVDLEGVRVIKDKRTGLSRQFGFAQFATVGNARAFLDEHYPSIQFQTSYDVPQSGDENPRVRIAYSREKDDRERPGKGEGDWICEICNLANYPHRNLCFRCHAPRTKQSATGVVGVTTHANVSTFSGFVTTGDSDVSPGNQASQFLLFRNLEPGVTEELLAKAVTKLYRVKDTVTPPDAQPSKRPKIASTSTDANLGAKEGSLKRVLLVRDRKTNDSWRYGFAEFSSVDAAQAAMAKYNSSDKFTISSKPVMVSYIHAGVFVPVLQAPSPEFAKFTFSPLSNPSMKLMYWDEGAYASEMAIARDEPSDLAKSKEKVHAMLAAAAAGEGLLGMPKDGGAKKRKIEKESSSSSKKIIAPHLQFWSNRHAELHGLSSNDVVETREGNDTSAATKIANQEPDAPPSQSFADMNRKCCLLCSRQFKTEAEVNKHERVSQLHRDNMLDDDLVAKALAKLGKQGVPSSGSYRDRAKERRQAFNQPKQPAVQHGKIGKDATSTTLPGTEEIVAAPVQSKGAALLGKMGWTAGEGLGAQGTGRTEAISTELYAQGVGLGAQGGKMGDAIEEANRSTGGSYADFVSRAKDKAKERFEQMS